jgi:hypothetical protein
LADSFADEKKIVAMLKVHGIKIKVTGARVKGGDVLYAVQVSDAVDFAIQLPAGTAVVVTHAADTTDERRDADPHARACCPRSDHESRLHRARKHPHLRSGAPTIRRPRHLVRGRSSAARRREEDNDDDVQAMAAAMVERTT